MPREEITIEDRTRVCFKTEHGDYDVFIHGDQLTIAADAVLMIMPAASNKVVLETRKSFVREEP